MLVMPVFYRHSITSLVDPSFDSGNDTEPDLADNDIIILQTLPIPSRLPSPSGYLRSVKMRLANRERALQYSCRDKQRGLLELNINIAA